MADFQLILLSEAKRPVPRERPSGAFLLIPFRDKAGMMISPEQQPEQATAAAPVWLLPGNALARVQQVIASRSNAVDTILGRLNVGLIKATYETLAWENTSRRHTI